MMVKRIVFLGVLLCWFTPQAFSTVSVGWKKNVIGPQYSPIYLYVKDIDGDGDLDVASTTNRHPLTWNSEVAWFRNNIDRGTPWEKFIISSSAPEDAPITNSNGIIISDIDKDGHEDVVVGTGKVTESIGSVYWFKAPEDSTGIWQRYDVDLGASNSYFKVYTMDVNDDEMEDIIIGGRQLAVIYINPGNPAQPGVLWEKIPMDAQTGSSLYLDDVNGDGKTDIVNSYLHGNVSWFDVDYIDGEVVLGRTMIDNALEYAFDVNCMDVNGDLKKDVLVSTLNVAGLYWYEAPLNGIDPWIQHTISTTFNGTDIYTGDINADVKTDLVASSAYGDKISMFEYDWVNEEVQWTETVIDDNINDPGDISLDDLDGDGDLDVVVAGLREDQMIWYENIINDLDDDKIINDIDNCPLIANANQLDSYPPGGNGCGDACECEGNFQGNDVDCDGTDAAIFKIDFGRNSVNRPCNTAAPCNGDFSCNGNVDGSDAARFKADFGRNGLNNPCPSFEKIPWCVYP
jgi:hypothetical protein